MSDDNEVRIRRMGAAKQIHTTEACRAIISEHGYGVKIIADLNFNTLTEEQAAAAHQQVQATVESALECADKLRHTNQSIWDVDELVNIQPDSSNPDMRDFV